MNENEVLEKMVDSLYLKTAVKDCFNGLCENNTASAFQTSAGGMVNIKTNETYQVQVIVTKDKDMFLGDFDLVEIQNK